MMASSKEEHEHADTVLESRAEGTTYHISTLKANPHKCNTTTAYRKRVLTELRGASSCRVGKGKVCITRYISPVSDKKHERLKIFDRKLLRFYEGYLRDEDIRWVSKDEDTQLKPMEKTILYTPVFPTVICMIRSGKATRTLVGKCIKEALRNAEN